MTNPMHRRVVNVAAIVASALLFAKPMRAQFPMVERPQPAWFVTGSLGVVATRGTQNDTEQALIDAGYGDFDSGGGCSFSQCPPQEYPRTLSSVDLVGEVALTHVAGRLGYRAMLGKTFFRTTNGFNAASHTYVDLTPQLETVSFLVQLRSARGLWVGAGPAWYSATLEQALGAPNKDTHSKISAQIGAGYERVLGRSGMLAVGVGYSLPGTVHFREFPTQSVGAPPIGPTSLNMNSLTITAGLGVVLGHMP